MCGDKVITVQNSQCHLISQNPWVLDVQRHTIHIAEILQNPLNILIYSIFLSPAYLFNFLFFVDLCSSHFVFEERDLLWPCIFRLGNYSLAYLLNTRCLYPKLSEFFSWQMIPHPLLFKYVFKRIIFQERIKYFKGEKSLFCFQSIHSC